MSLIANVGISGGSDPYVVGANACQDAVAKLGGKSADLIIVFSSVEFEQEKMLAGVRSVSGDALLVGCSTAGEITGEGPAKQHSVAVMALASDSVHFHAGVGKGLKENAKEAGRLAARNVAAQANNALKFFMMFADGLSGNGSEAVRGILDELGAHFPVVGGSAGDDAKYKQTFQYLNGDVLSNSVVGLGFSGLIEFAFGVNHGWIPVGIPMKVTKAEGSILREINGKPAITIYEEYFGPKEAAALKEKTLAELALSYPLGIVQNDSNEFLLRAPFFVNTDGSIVCGGEMPENAEVRLMVGNKEDAIVAARNAAKRAREQLSADPAAAIIFSCHVRDKLFASREKGKEEIDVIQEIIGGSVPLIGFYTYAEQAPIGGESRNIGKCNPALHNETVVICLFREGTNG